MSFDDVCVGGWRVGSGRIDVEKGGRFGSEKYSRANIKEVEKRVLSCLYVVGRGHGCKAKH